MNKFKDVFIKVYSHISVLLILSFVFTIFYFIFSKGIFEVNLTFLTEEPKGLPLGSEGGISTAILGSFLLLILSTTISGVLAVSCALYNAVFCKYRWVKLMITFLVSSISAVPSIVLGLFVYGFFIVTLNIPLSLLTASISLSLMIFSFIEISTEKAINEVDRQFIRDSFSLGVEKTYMCRKLILPIISKNLISTFILAGSYAIGATAPLLLTGVVFMAKPNGLLSPVMALPFHLHMLLSQSVAIEKAYGTAVVLVLILLFMHIFSELIMRNIGGKIIESIRNKKS